MSDDVSIWLEGLRQTPPVIPTESAAREITARVRGLLLEANNVQPLQTPVTVVGDIHGQFYDLLKLFEVGGDLPSTGYIFLGDYVDRGHNSVETLFYLLLLKLKWPDRITLLRGNHESRQITQFYGFYDECIRKYGNTSVWRYCTDLFDYLSLAAVVDDRIYCVHGGLSPSLRHIDQLRLVHRLQEIPTRGPFGDSLWSDPDSQIENWAISPRGSGWLFGHKVTDEFCHYNDIVLIARAHQLVQKGFEYVFPKNNLVTVWSAPNYCYRCGNVASIMKLTEDGERSFLVFEETVQTKTALRKPKSTLPYFL